VVILNPNEPINRVKTFLSDPLYAHRVQYIRGSSLESRSLKKANAKNASAYFILAKKYTQQSETIDAENVLKAMVIKKNFINLFFFFKIKSLKAVSNIIILYLTLIKITVIK